jgi:putative transposase
LAYSSWTTLYNGIIFLGNHLKAYLEKGLLTIPQFHPDVVSEKFSLQADHVHLLLVLPPRYAVSAIMGKLKANTSREVRTRFPRLKKIYWRTEFWSVGFFSSTVGIKEDGIKRYVEFQEKIDKGQVPLTFEF